MTASKPSIDAVRPAFDASFLSPCRSRAAQYEGLFRCELTGVMLCIPHADLQVRGALASEHFRKRYFEREGRTVLVILLPRLDAAPGRIAVTIGTVTNLARVLRSRTEDVVGAEGAVLVPPKRVVGARMHRNS